MNVRQADGSGVVHEAKPRMEETYCGRAVDEEEWVITPKEADCAPPALGRGRPPSRRGPRGAEGETSRSAEALGRVHRGQPAS